MCNIVECTLTDNGWSSDKKLLIRDAKGNKYMLRLSDISKKTEKDKEYEMISSLWKSFAFYPLHAALYSIK